MPIAHSVRRSVLLALCAALLAAGCQSSSGSSSGDGGEAAGYPRTVENCGRKVRVEAPPERAVSLNQGTTEIMLSLGLADRMAGTATWTDPLPKKLRKPNTGVKRLADNAPSFEKVLGEEPDFVSASFEANLSKGGVAPRERFEKLGVPSYLSPADCMKDNSGDDDGRRKSPLTMEPIYREVRDLAKVFGVEKRGERLVDRLKTRMAKATSTLDGVGTEDITLLYWFANSESPYMGGCCGAPGVITESVGAKNVFDDNKAEWPQINWETVAERDPDVLVVGDLTRKSETAESAREKIEFLESNPATKNMDAVRNKRYVRLSGQAMNPSIRTVEGVEKVAAAVRGIESDR